jgi:hypothetical protein
MTTAKRHRHKWSPKHKRGGVDLWVRSCLVVDCDAITDGKQILYKDGTIGRLSKELRRQMATLFTLQSSQLPRPEGKA